MNRELLSDLPERLRLKIRAGLLPIDPNGPDKKDTKACLNEAYDVFARVLSQAGELLSDSLLKEEIPARVFQWAVAQKWLTWPPQRPRRDKSIFVPGKYKSAYEPIPEHELTVVFGVYAVTERYKAYVMKLFEPAIARWEAEAAESGGNSDVPGSDSNIGEQGVKGMMVYPDEFSAQARARVEIERLKANRRLEQVRAGTPSAEWTQGTRVWDQCAFYAYILRVFLAFTREACELGKQGIWTADRIRADANEFLRMFTIVCGFPHGMQHMVRGSSR